MTTTVPQDSPKAARVSRDVREEIEDFLFDEADLLDRDEFEEWLELLDRMCTISRASVRRFAEQVARGSLSALCT